MNRDVGGPLAIPIARIAQLERSRGAGRCSRNSDRAQCILVGALVGALVPALPALLGGGGYGTGVYLTVIPPIGVVVGAVIGGLAGGERWERVPILMRE
jgi:hypothetical protein